MKNPPGKIFQENIAVLRKFYKSAPVALNFCNPWQRINQKRAAVTFECVGSVPLKGAKEMTLTTTFYAEKKGIALIGIGCGRTFEVFCNGTLCCSTAGEGKLYDLLAPENHPFLLPVAKGENTLEVHLSAGDREDLFCCRVLEKGALKVPYLLYPPVHTLPGEGKLCVVARTAGGVGSGIEYRKAGESQWSLQWDQRGGLIRRQSLHRFFLKELVPGTQYEYRIIMIDPADPDRIRRSSLYSFIAPGGGKKKDFSFFFTADCQFEPERQRELLRGLLETGSARECDFLVLGGDINSRYSTARMEEDLIPVLQKYADPESTLVMLRGNHELRGPEPDAFNDFWGDEEGNAWGLFPWGDAAFLVLDAWENRPADHPRGKYYSRHNLDSALREKEKEFIRQAVDSPLWKNAKFRIVLAHGAPFSHFDRAGTMYKLLQELTDEFFCGEKPVSKVHLWLAGHTHIYTRSIPRSKELAAFAVPREPGKSAEEYIFPVLTVCGPNSKGLPQLSCFRVDVAADSLHVRSCLPDGTIFEELRITPDHRVEELLSLPRFIPEREEL